jgi:hypothetical protein
MENTNTTNELFAGLEALVSNNNLFEPVTTTEPVVTTTEEEISSEEKTPYRSLTAEEVEQEMKAQREAEVPTTETGDGEQNEDVYSGMAEFFKEKGIVSKEFKTAEEMIEVFKAERQNDIDEYKASLPEVVKELIDNYEEGVPLTDLISIKSEKIVLSQIDEESIAEDVELQKNLYREALRQTTKFDNVKIERLVKQAEDLMELEERAKESHVDLVEINAEKEKEAIAKAKADEIAAKQHREKLISDINTTVKSTTEIIPGIKISEAEQKELVKALTTAAEIRNGKTYSRAMLEKEKDPIGFELKLNYFIQKGLFEGKFDEIFKKAETGVTKKLEKDIEESARKLAAKTSGNLNRVAGEEPSFLSAWKTRKK